jgi:hypothetical protein
MRGVLISLLVVFALAVPSQVAAGGAPALRVGTGPSLAIVGTGFAPRSVVRLHLVGPGIDRRSTVRAGARGGFFVSFAGYGRCSVDAVTAIAPNGVRTRVPTPWFVRECPPPPPLQPAPPAA